LKEDARRHKSLDVGSRLGLVLKQNPNGVSVRLRLVPNRFGRPRPKKQTTPFFCKIYFTKKNNTPVFSAGSDNQNQIERNRTKIQ